MKRANNRKFNELRKIEIITQYLKYADGSCLISFGDTKVICSAVVQEGVPQFLEDKEMGWLTAEYSLLPASCQPRVQRESARGKQDGRSLEIQRLVGRCLRTVTDLKAFPDKTIWIDCDVIQADGGTRCASITGAFVALNKAFIQMDNNKQLFHWPIKDMLCAVSVGIINEQELLDLNYAEDSNADVDLNLAITSSGKIVEIQGTGEKASFSIDELDKMIKLALTGSEEIFKIMKKSL